MRIAVMIGISALLGSVAILSAQQAAKPVPRKLTPAAAAPAQPVATPAPADDPQPTLSNAEKFSLLDFDDQIAPLAEKMNEIQSKRQAWVNALNSAHPGWRWHDGRQQGDKSEFRREPTPPSAPVVK